MTADALVAEDTPEVDEAIFPPDWQQGDQRLALSYRFEPGADDDGVTVQVPLALLARLAPAGFDWQVPGLRAELVTALIKSLPKAIRRNVVPAADWATRLLTELPAAPGVVSTGSVSTGRTSGSVSTGRPRARFTDTLAALIQRLTHVPVTGRDFELDRVPAHLRMTFRVVDERGRAVASGKDLEELQRRLGSRVRESVAAASAATPNAIERGGLTTWDFAELPRFLDTKQAENTIRGYPTLVDEGQSVAIRMMSTEAEQARYLPTGVRRLLLAATPSPAAYVQQHLTGAEKLSLATSPYRSTAALFEDCLAACVDDVLYRVRPGGQVFMRAEFDSIRDRVSGVVMDSMFETAGLVARILTASRAADKLLKASTSMALLPALSDARQQLEGLVYPGFVSATGLTQLRHLPRYLGRDHRPHHQADRQPGPRPRLDERGAGGDGHGSRMPAARSRSRPPRRPTWCGRAG